LTYGKRGKRLNYAIHYGEKRPACRLEDMDEARKQQILEMCEQLASLKTPLKNLQADRAIGACEQAVELKPKDHQLLYYLARAYRKAGDYPRMEALAKEAGELGNANAWYLLGYVAMKGLDGAVDPVKARGYFEKAAKMGFAKAQIALGILYAQGLGVPKDYAEAERHFRMAISEGSEIARKNLQWLERLKRKEEEASKVATDTNTSEGNATAQ